jgi:CO/xanthine dehydrogenase Mo-binding subunit
VDVETGVVSVHALHAVVAGGPFADPRLAAAQVEGGLAAALERALVAGLDGAHADGATPAWPRGLPLCTASDVPPLAVSFVPGDDPLSRFDTAALAEAAARAATAAIANAVARASGLRLRTLPLDPGRLLAALPEAPS